ncbi:Mutant cadherin [Operophtera brumata]|uniref:Mutant cadherin n=1 Tax=Operophtera brumata TaxID=104452 RepID=A0A0L7KTM0_OPEBR|nr:Mutant cadherin [Operophtera brumata]
MTFKVVKCNIVICEVLAFIQNKIDVMSEESIVRICTTSFTTEEIEQAKSLLFESITTTKRKITRKRDGRSQRDLFDVISVFKETDPDETPNFVARMLQRLPPVLWDHLDATRILRDILVIQSDLKALKETCVTVDKLEEVKSDLFNLKQASIVNNYECYVNNKRGGGGMSNSYFIDSGPTGLPHITERIMTHNRTAEMTSPSEACLEPTLSSTGAHDCNKTSYAPIRSTNDGRRVNITTASNTEITTAPPALQKSTLHSQVDMPNVGSRMKHQAASTPESFAKVVSAEGRWKEEKPNDGWILAQRKRHRNRFITAEGKASTNPS